jgi:hypothetical protein
MRRVDVKNTKDMIDKIAEQYGQLLEPTTKLTHGFIARAMVLASLPHREPKENTYIRVNGNYTLSMTANSKFGLPYGSIPRLLLAWITTEAVLKKERHLVLGENLSDFMRQLDIEPTGGKNGSITALRNQMDRLLNTAISCVFADGKQKAGINMFLADKYFLWWDPKDPQQLALMPSTLDLSETFFNEITESPVIFYMEALKALRKSPMALDLYMWLTYKNSYYRNPVVISWESLQLQFGAGYPITVRGKLDFKKKFIEALKRVCTIYSEARKLEVLEAGLKYIPGYPHVPKLK